MLVALLLVAGVCNWCSCFYFLQLDCDQVSCLGSMVQLGTYEETSRYCKEIFYSDLRKTGFGRIQ